MVNLARRNLLHDRLRFLITVAGVAFAVNLVLTQVGLFMGLLGNASVVIEHLPADLWVTSKGVPNIDFAKPFPETLLQRVRSVPGVGRADNMIATYFNVSQPAGGQETMVVYALENFGRWGMPWIASQGDAADLRRGNFLMLDESARRRIGNFKVGEYREILEHRLKIIGTSKEAMSFTTTPVSFMDFRLAQRLASQTLGGQTNYILVKAAPGANLEAVRAEIRRRLPHNDVLTRREWAAQSRNYWTANTGLGVSMYTTVFLGCLVGIVIVAQTLYTSTMEHLKEFGTVKAIGGGNADIYRILVEQSVISAVVGFVLGAAMAYATVPAVKSLGLHLLISPAFAATVFVGTVLMCLAASTISFRKVASIDPALVFRT